MAYETKPNTGSLFVNNSKESDKHPDRRGSALIDGVEYWCDGWLKKSQAGVPWLSLSFKRKDQKAAPKPASKPPAWRFR